ncbi:hypothetical protein [Frigoriglobus tundricola]|nr:hypothetical protein [Frigoriglobus tundricola]
MAANLDQRWHLLGMTTNTHGVKHFTITGAGDHSDDADFNELLRVLKCQFGATDEGVLTGPYSVHRYMAIEGFRFGVILDSPNAFDIYATETHQKDTMESFVTRFLGALNESSR